MGGRRFFHVFSSANASKTGHKHQFAVNSPATKLCDAHWGLVASKRRRCGDNYKPNVLGIAVRRSMCAGYTVFWFMSAQGRVLIAEVVKNESLAGHAN